MNLTARFSTYELPGIFRVCQLVLAIFVVSMLHQSCVAQTWPVHSPEVYEAVPQYNAGQNSATPTSIPAPPQAVSQSTVKSHSAVGSQSANAQQVPAVDPTEHKIYPLNYDIYRDRTRFPVDPRKPCNSCTHPASTQPFCKLGSTGKYGRPYMEKEPGGCLCDKRHPPKHDEFSIYWPRPFSAKLDDRHPEKAAARYAPCQKKRIVDVFDHLSTFKLSKYQRTDNGYCGPGSDPYGCLGESRHVSRVRGVEFRSPGQPVAPGNFSN